MSSSLRVGNVSVGRVDGRGRLSGTVEIRHGDAFIRIEDQRDPSVWVEVLLYLNPLMQASAQSDDENDGEDLIDINETLPY